MAGKRAVQKADRERRIFRAACQLFAEKGYHATGMDDLASQAGLSVGTLYNYFDSKAAVLLAVLRTEIELLIKASNRLIAAPPSEPQEGLNALAEIFLKGLGRDRDLWRNLWAGALATPNPYESGFFEVDDVLTARFTDLIAHYQDEGRLTTRVPAAAGAATLYAFYSQALMAFLWDKRISMRRLLKDCRAATAVVLHGLGAAH